MRTAEAIEKSFRKDFQKLLINLKIAILMKKKSYKG